VLKLALACLEARIGFADDVQTALTANNFAIAVAVFKAFEGG
jgi:hypothetical protein